MNLLQELRTQEETGIEGREKHGLGLAEAGWVERWLRIGCALLGSGMEAAPLLKSSSALKLNEGSVVRAWCSGKGHVHMPPPFAHS